MEILNVTNGSSTAEASKEVFAAKIVSGFILLIATSLATFIPAFIVRRAIVNPLIVNGRSERSRRTAKWKTHLLSAFNCFAGGVFISAGLLHVFVDADEDVKAALKVRGIDTEFPLTMFIMLCGVFLLLVIEKFADFIAKQQSDNPSLQPLVADSHSSKYDVEFSNKSFTPIRDPSENEETFEAEAITSHSNIVRPTHSSLQSIVLAIALSVHSVFEGLALGLQHTVSETYDILLVISLHKLVIAASMGVNLGQARIKTWLVLLIAGIFCFASPMGAFVGAGVSEAADVQHGMSVGVLQALACGTFVYVTFFEILPHEFHKRGCIRSLCLVSLMIGFGGVALYTFLGGDPDGHHHDVEPHVHG